VLGLISKRSLPVIDFTFDCFEQATGSTSETRRGLTVPCSLQGSNMSSRGRNPGALPPATHLTLLRGWGESLGTIQPPLRRPGS
jgi:hypothetical protein